MIQQNQELEHNKMSNNNKDLLNFWEDQMKQSHTSSNYFFRKSPSHYHMMLLVMSAYKHNEKLSVEVFSKRKNPFSQASLIIKADFGLEVLKSLVFNSSTESFLFSLNVDITNSII